MAPGSLPADVHISSSFGSSAVIIVPGHIVCCRSSPPCDGELRGQTTDGWSRPGRRDRRPGPWPAASSV